MIREIGRFPRERPVKENLWLGGGYYSAIGRENVKVAPLLGAECSCATLRLNRYARSFKTTQTPNKNVANANSKGTINHVKGVVGWVMVVALRLTADGASGANQL